MTRAWIVRGGQFGEREEQALKVGLAIAGWPETGDLSTLTSIGDLDDFLRGAYPDQSNGTRDNWKHQLWRFLTMQTGDFVVMPRKYQPVVAIGRLTGDYEYRGDALPGFRHVRTVEWLRTGVERTAIGGDLRDSMGAFLTVSELRRRDAAQRVRSLAESGTDPGYDGGIEPPPTPEALEQDVQGDGSRQLTARDLIGLWGWQRRTTEVIDLVDRELARRGLRAEPHFTDVRLDGLITVSANEEDRTDAGRDLSWRIGNLAFIRNPVTVGVEDPLSRAITRMVEGDFSQLPVVDPHNRLCGVVTWETIARAQLGRRSGTISDALDPHPRTAREQEELFARIGDIQHRGFLIIVDAENIAIGILTASDLAGELRVRVEPFTLLEEVERRLRRITSRLPTVALPTRSRQRRERGENLTFGQYPFVIEDDVCWGALGWPFEQADMAQRLRSAAQYRNALAHWDVDGPSLDTREVAETEHLLKLLKVIDRDLPA